MILDIDNLDIETSSAEELKRIKAFSFIDLGAHMFAKHQTQNKSIKIKIEGKRYKKKEEKVTFSKKCQYLRRYEPRRTVKKA